MADKRPFRPVDRLHQASEFSAVFQNRRVIRGQFFDLHWRPNEDMAGSIMFPVPIAGARLGLVVPKRLARRAVMRNLMKRIAREVFRHNRIDLPAMDLILKLARKPVSDQISCHPTCREFRQLLAQDMENLLAKLVQRCGEHSKP